MALVNCEFMYVYIYGAREREREREWVYLGIILKNVNTTDYNFIVFTFQ